MNKLFALGAAFALFSNAAVVVADDSCIDSENPMSWSEGFGIASCKRQAPRHHSRDFSGYTRHVSEDPMVWSETTWRTSLMGYARGNDDRFDRRTHRVAMGKPPIVRVEIEKVIVADVPGEQPAPQVVKPKGPKISYLRKRADAERPERGADFVGHQCRGILVLTWKAGVARSKCLDSRTRIHRAPE